MSSVGGTDGALVDCMGFHARLQHGREVQHDAETNRKAVRQVFENSSKPSATDQQATDYLLLQFASILTASDDVMCYIPDDLTTIADMVDLYHDDPVRFYACTEGMTKEKLGTLVAFSMVAKKQASTKDVYTEPPWSKEEVDKIEVALLEKIKEEAHGEKRPRTEESE